jgi:DNA mismatch repair protein MutS2
VQFSPAPEEGRSSEINVIGLSRDEAVDRLDKFLDDAFLTGFPSVRVIHGSGKGILRDAVASFLETHPHVSGYELAPPEQGGGGVTIVEMRE